MSACQIPADLLAAAPRAWIDYGQGLRVRVIDPVWRRKTLARIEAEAVAAIDVTAPEPVEEPILAIEPPAPAPILNRAEQLSKMPFVRRTIEAVADKHGLTRDEIVSPGKTPDLVVARAEVVFRLRENGLSFMKIGRAVHRDNSTVRYALRFWNDRVERLGLDRAMLPDALPAEGGLAS